MLVRQILKLGSVLTAAIIFKANWGYHSEVRDDL